MTFRIRACLNGKPLPPHEDKKEKGWVYKTRAAAERRKKELDDYRDKKRWSRKLAQQSLTWSSTWRSPSTDVRVGPTAPPQERIEDI